MTSTIKIGIAEDHPLVREGLVSSLKPHKNIVILFEVANGKELLDKLKTERPDILLLDIEMPVMRAPEVLKKMNIKYPKIKVIIISAFFQKDYIIECYKLGVKAFLPKADEPEKILEAIKEVHEKGYHASNEITGILANELQNTKNNTSAEKPNLSNAELEVLKLICKGLQRKKAAEQLGVKPETVNFHMKNIMRKTNTENASALVSYAIQNKLVNV